MTRRKLSQLQLDTLARVMRSYPWFSPQSDEERDTLIGLWLMGILERRRVGPEAHKYRLSGPAAKSIWRSLP